jgi:peptidoglycan/LPS O-acetylase OafA/YrhL
MLEKPLYFPGLNGLRALAALTVIVWHVDSSVKSFNLSDIGLRQNGLAGYAVNLFFVLSGFLITYLLISEKEKTGTIDIKKFYMRRLLRIWPLYYLSIIIACILMYFQVISVPEELTTSMMFYIFLLANVSFVTNIGIKTIQPLWSVGVEEQFYAVWPWIIKKSTSVLKSLIIVIVLYFIIKSCAWVYDYDSKIYSFISYARIDLMALGGIGSLVIFNNYIKLKRVFFSKTLQFISWGILFISFVYKPIHIVSFIDNEINAFFYLVILLNVSSNPDSIIKLEGKVFNFFGKISYGLYIYHMIVIVLFVKYLDSFEFFSSSLIIKFSLPFLIIGVTTIISWLSYHYFEKPILKIKNRFEVVKSSAKKD